MDYERVFTSEPIRAMWNRMDILTTVSGVKNFLKEKCRTTNIVLDEEIINEKAKGIAFCIRSAKELFKTPIDANLTAACISYYYGTLNFLSALLLAKLDNKMLLSDIEKTTKYGHGLKLLYNEPEDNFINDALVIMENGFFYKYLKEYGYDVKKISFQGKIPYSLNEVPEEKRDKLFKVKDLISRIPELKNIYIEIFREQPKYLSYSPDHSNQDEIEITFYYYENSPFLTKSDIYDILNWPESIELIETNVYNERAIKTKEKIKKGLVPSEEKLYHSDLANSCFIKPILSINDVMLIYFMFLYDLSIISRYRPKLWRDILEGKLDIYRSLITNFLMSAERILPNIFLNKFYNRNFIFAGHSYLG